MEHIDEDEEVQEIPLEHPVGNDNVWVDVEEDQLIPWADRDYNDDPRGVNVDLHLAVMRRDERRMEEAIEDGASPDFCYGGGKTVLHQLCEGADDHVDFYAVLKKNFEENNRPMNLKNKRDDSGNTPLHTALFNQNFALARKLIEEGTDTNLRNGNEQTPLHVYCLQGTDETDIVVQILLSSGTVDLNAVDNQNKTPRDVALDRGMKDVAALLLKYQLR